MSAGKLDHTGSRNRADPADKFRGAGLGSSIKPAWLYSGGALRPLYTFFPIGTKGDPLSDTSLHDAYLRNPSAGWDPQDMDIGDCHRIGGLAPGIRGTRVGSWLGMSRAYSGAALRNATS